MITKVMRIMDVTILEFWQIVSVSVNYSEYIRKISDYYYDDDDDDGVGDGVARN